jgi:hypothetical protein
MKELERTLGGGGSTEARGGRVARRRLAGDNAGHLALAIGAPTNDGPADYALCVAQRIQAVVEAKKYAF